MDYFTPIAMLEIRPQLRAAWPCYAKLSGLAGVLAVLLFTVLVSNLVYLTTVTAFLYNAGMLLVMQCFTLPLFLLFLQREKRKHWAISETGVDVYVVGRIPVNLKWADITEVFFKRYSVSIFHGEDRDEKIIYFLGQEHQDQLSRFWHANRTDVPDRSDTLPDDNSLDA